METLSTLKMRKILRFLSSTLSPFFFFFFVVFAYECFEIKGSGRAAAEGLRGKKEKLFFSYIERGSYIDTYVNRENVKIDNFFSLHEILSF
jgi:TRAP-type C4-dicarboxylate transport system permease small subunit